MTRDEIHLLEKSFQPIAEGVILLDPAQFTILYINPKLERILGFTAKDLVGKELSILMPEDQGMIHIQDVIQENESASKISWKLQTKSKELVDVDFSIQYLEPSQENDEGLVILYIQDTTELRNMEKMIQFTQNLLHAIREIKQAHFLNQPPSEIFEITCRSLRKARDFDIVWGILKDPFENEPIVSFEGKQPSFHSYRSRMESVYQTSEDPIPIKKVLQDPFTIMEFHSTVSDRGYSRYYSCFPDQPRLEALCFQISWNNIVYGAIELIYFDHYPFAEDDIHILQELGADIGFAIYSRINEQIKLDAIRKIEYQGLLLDNIDVPILSVDRNGNIQYANNSAESRLKYPLVEMLEMNVFSVLGFTPGTIQYIRSRTMKREMIVSNRRTAPFPALIHSSPISGKNHEFLGVMIVVFDITEQKEQELKNRNLDRLLIESAKFASIGELAAGIAHEINNPLQSALLYLEDLIQVEEEDPAERKKILQIIESANLRIKTLVKSLLDLGRSPSTEKEWTDLTLVVERAVELVEVNSKKHNVTIQSSIHSPLPKLYIHWQEIEQVVLNCLINSINAISEMTKKPDQPRIRIVLEPAKFMDKESVLCSIEDNGPGIDPQMIEKVFLPLFTTRREKHGTGLGLAISKKIITSHGGEIFIDPYFKGGNRIQFYLPVDFQHD